MERENCAGPARESESVCVGMGAVMGKMGALVK